jgi:hypothetical protein
MVMIESAEEFVALRTSENSELYQRAAHDTATDSVWMDIIARYPDMRQWVAHNKTSPVHVLRILARDPDARVRHAVAMTRRAEPDVLDMLASDPDSSVRLRVACNKKTPKEVLLKLAEDPWEQIAEVARRRL